MSEEVENFEDEIGKDCDFLIPAYIGRENFRSFVTAGSMKKLFCIDGKAPSSFIHARAYHGRPIKSHINSDGHRLYKVSNVVAAARAAAKTIMPPHTLEWQRKSLEFHVERLIDRKDALESMIENLESELNVLTFKKSNNHLLKTLNDELDFELLSEKEIVSHSKGSIPSSGIYFLVKGNEVVYVGQSSSVLSRIGTHILDKNKEFDAFSFMSVPKESLDILETIYIKVLNPKFNSSSPISKDRITAYFQHLHTGTAA